jgi:Tannase and feruloyl esterase
MIRKPFFIFIRGIVAGGANALSGPAQAEEPETDVSAQCKSLESADFSNIFDAPTQIAKAKMVEAKGEAPAYCQVQGYVTPQVGFELRLPTANWNKKFIEIGCGGHCGDTNWTYWRHSEKGYACIVSDAGHKGTGSDGLWGYSNLQAKLDWGYRAAHVVALAGKAITEHFYQEAAKKSYFMGCSTGGRQALQEAQRFPWDFDGIIAGAPPVNLSTVYMTFAWGILATHDKRGKPLLGKVDLKLVTDAAIAQCDLDDGVKDGTIGDPRHCRFDPAELTCKANQTTACLTPVQVDAVKKVYAGPMISEGVKLSLGGPLPGSEYGRWNDNSGGGWSVAYLGVDGKPATYEPLVIAGLEYLFFSPELGSSRKLIDFDFDRDYKRMGVMESLYDSSNPDLRKFKAAGGKLLSYQGTNDISVLPQITEDYYETVERTKGGREATQSFYRLLVLPGVEHCGGGDGADTVDYLSTLEAWVEDGKAPDRLMAAHMKKNHTLDDMPSFPLDPNQVQFTRPVYPYSTRAKYRGRGDPNVAESFGPSAQ